jgi:hypothetical protein
VLDAESIQKDRRLNAVLCVLHPHHAELHQKFDNFKDASEREAFQQTGRCPNSDYFVTMFYAKTDEEAEEKTSAKYHPRREAL